MPVPIAHPSFHFISYFPLAPYYPSVLAVYRGKLLIPPPYPDRVTRQTDGETGCDCGYFSSCQRTTHAHSIVSRSRASACPPSRSWFSVSLSSSSISPRPPPATRGSPLLCPFCVPSLAVPEPAARHCSLVGPFVFPSFSGRRLLGSSAAAARREVPTGLNPSLPRSLQDGHKMDGGGVRGMGGGTMGLAWDATPSFRYPFLHPARSSTPLSTCSF